MRGAGAVSTIELTGLRKAAILLVQLGQTAAAQILAHLKESEVEELVSEVARLQTIPPATADAVMAEFFELSLANKYASQGGLGYARDLLESGLGPDKAREIMERLQATIAETPFMFLRRTDPRQLLSFLQEEHAQTIALVLAHLSPDQAYLVLSGLPGGLQADVAHRIAVMDRTSPEVVRKVESVLQRRMSSVLQPTDLSNVGGVEPLIEIINRTDRATERMILDGLMARDPALAEEIRAQMFMFEDIVTLDNKSIQKLLGQVPSEDLVVALKGVSTEVKTKITGNLSERARNNLEEEIQFAGAKRLSEVEEAQSRIIQVIRMMEEKGEIVLQRAGDDDALVS